MNNLFINIMNTQMSLICKTFGLATDCSGSSEEGEDSEKDTGEVILMLMNLD